MSLEYRTASVCAMRPAPFFTDLKISRVLKLAVGNCQHLAYKDQVGVPDAIDLREAACGSAIVGRDAGEGLAVAHDMLATTATATTTGGNAQGSAGEDKVGVRDVIGLGQGMDGHAVPAGDSGQGVAVWHRVVGAASPAGKGLGRFFGAARAVAGSIATTSTSTSTAVTTAMRRL